MLQHYLLHAVKDIYTLIEITRNDIEDIKQAKHEKLFSRNRTKEDLILSFENKKAIIDHEVMKVAKANPGKNMEELLDQKTSDLLNSLRDSLKELKNINKRYARMVLAVYEFYNSLLERVLPSENNGYENSRRSSSSFLQVKA